MWKFCVFNGAASLFWDEACVDKVENCAIAQQKLSSSKDMWAGNDRDTNFVRGIWAERSVRRCSIYGNFYVNCGDCAVSKALLGRFHAWRLQWCSFSCFWRMVHCLWTFLFNEWTRLRISTDSFSGCAKVVSWWATLLPYSVIRKDFAVAVESLIAIFPTSGSERFSVLWVFKRHPVIAFATLNCDVCMCRCVYP